MGGECANAFLPDLTDAAQQAFVEIVKETWKGNTLVIRWTLVQIY